MFTRVKKRVNKDGTVREYLQIVENRRVDGKIRQRVLCTLGRLDELRQGQLDRLIDSLVKFSEKRAVLDQAQELFAHWSREYGPALIFRRLWETTGLALILEQAVAHTRIAFDVCEAVYAMVLNRLMDPASKVGVAEWAAKEVYEPRFSTLELHHYYRALDFLAGCKETIEEQLFLYGRDLFNQQVDIVFFDTTSVYLEGQPRGELLQYGYSKDHRPDRPQVLVGLLMLQDGTPIAHEVLPGNTADVAAFLTAIQRLKHRFSINRVIIVADRGTVSKKTLAALDKAGYSYILGMRMRRVKEIAEIILRRAGRYQEVAANLQVKNVNYEGKRYVICYNPEEAKRDALAREEVLQSLQTKLQAGGVKSLVGNSAYRKYLTVNADQAEIDAAKVEEEARYDGKYVLQTTTDLPAAEVAKAYKQLWRVERAFRELKQKLDVRPMYHWTDKRIRGHVMVCFLAFYLETRLYQALREVAPAACYTKVLRDLARVKAVQLTVNGRTFVARTQLEGDAHLAFKAVKMRVPSQVLHQDTHPKEGV
ncbi:MAG: IS1634 family transposase [Peptococcaceae bacterium]|nr:IS1634 family transposase [Peptococcaceae bacterium]